jgi:ubiquinone/menaquinone biosynthesis C-methylase UbiE
MSSSGVPTSGVQAPTGGSQYAMAGNVAARELFNRRTVERDAAHLLPRLHPGMRVVDFGCGAGSLTPGLAAIVAPGEVLGFDLSAEAIDRARELARESGLNNVRFEVGNIDGLQVPEPTFDLAHFSGVLAYLRDPPAALKLAYRALKPGGAVAAREPQKDGDWFGGPCAEAAAVFHQVAMQISRANGGDPCLGRRLATLLREAGFEHIDQRPCYCAALADVRATARVMLSALERPEARARALTHGGITAATFDRLAEEITTWAASEDSIAAFAECSAIAWRPTQAR